MSNNDPADNSAAIAVLDAADQANQATNKGRSGDEPKDLVDFVGQLAFLRTIGYLTKDQSRALADWFFTQGATKLPDLPGPEGITGPRMYELLATRIQFPPPGSDTGPENIFEDIGRALVGLADTVISETERLLEAGTGLLRAGTDLLHEVHAILHTVSE